MNSVSYLICIIFIAFIALYPIFLWFSLLCLVFVAAILLAISGTVTVQIMLSMKHTARYVNVLSSFSNFHKYIPQSYNNHVHKTKKRLPVIFGRSVDIALQELLDLIVRDLISSWLENLTFSYKKLQFSFK